MSEQDAVGLTQLTLTDRRLAYLFLCGLIANTLSMGYISYRLGLPTSSTEFFLALYTVIPLVLISTIVAFVGIGAVLHKSRLVVFNYE